MDTKKFEKDRTKSLDTAQSIKKEVSWNKLLTGLVMVFFLLLLALLIGTIPTLLKKPTQETPTLSGNAEKISKNIFGSISEPNIQDILPTTQSKPDQREKMCNNLLTADSEEYDYSYLFRNNETSLLISLSSILDTNRNIRITKIKTTNFGDVFDKIQDLIDNSSENSSTPAIGNVSSILPFSINDITIEYTTKLNVQNKCASATIKMNFAEKEILQNASCSDAQVAPQICGDELVKTGKDNVSITAGTFDAETYKTKENDTIWLSENLPLLLKSTSENTSIELTSYQKKR